MRPSTRKHVALLVSFFLLVSVGAQAFDVRAFMHKLDLELHELNAAGEHDHRSAAAHEPFDVAPMDGLQHLALHAMGDIQPTVLSAFAHTSVTPVTSAVLPLDAAVAPGRADSDPPFRPPQSV